MLMKQALCDCRNNCHPDRHIRPLWIPQRRHDVPIKVRSEHSTDAIVGICGDQGRDPPLGRKDFSVSKEEILLFLWTCLIRGTMNAPRKVRWFDVLAMYLLAWTPQDCSRVGSSGTTTVLAG